MIDALRYNQVDMAQISADDLLDLDPETGLPDPFSGAEDEEWEGAEEWVDEGSPETSGFPDEFVDDLVEAPEGTEGEITYNPVTGLPEDSLTPFEYDATNAAELAADLSAFEQTLKPAVNQAQQALQMAFSTPALTQGGRYVGIDPLNGNLVYANADGTPIATMATQGKDANGQTMYTPTPSGINTMAAANPADPTGTGWLNAVNGAMGAVNGLLSTPLGKIAGSALIGGLGLGASALFAGSTTKVKPAEAPNTATINQLLATGQGQTLAGMQEAGAAPNRGLTGATSQGLQGQSNLASLANLQAQQQLDVQRTQQPVEQGIAMNALGTIPGLMNATTNPNITGTGQVGQLANSAAAGLIPQGGQIAGGIGQQIQNVLAGNYSNPILENNVKMRQQEFQQRMAAQLGPDWQNTTTGMQAAQQQALLEESLRFQDQQQTIANYTPLFNASTGLQTNTGSNATTQVQGAQAQGLGQAAQVSQMGKQNVGQITNTLASVAPTSPLSGVQSASQASAANLANQQQAAVTNAATENKADQSLSKGIGDLTGAVIGGLSKTG